MTHSRHGMALLLAGALLLGLTACGQGTAADISATSPDTQAQLLSAEGSTTVSFADVPANAGYAPAVAWCLRVGLMNGTSDTAFSPNDTLTRAMVVTVLYRAEGEPEVNGTLAFGDAQAEAWYSNAVLWANTQGIVQGYGNGLFGVNDPITREQLDVILRRYQGEAPAWTGDPALAVPATRAEAAVAFYESLSGRAEKPAADSITTNGGEVIALADLAHQSGNADSAVYYLSDISSEGLISVYHALNWTPGDHVAVKLSTGEPGSNYLRTDLIGPLVQSLTDPTIVECNTAYGGQRANTAMHYQVAADHGYTEIAKVDIMDENGSMTLPVTGGSNLKENYVGASFANYDSFLVLSHFKGHAMAGFGGAIKNISIGIASSRGKSHIHSGGTGGNMWSGEQNAFLESMAEAGKSVVEALDGRIVYINVMNRLSVDCDCDGSPAAPDMHDIGILASYDPVALDQACVDLVYAVRDGRSLISRMESRNGIHTLEHGSEIGLGNREYRLVDLGAGNPDSGSSTNHRIKLTVNGQECTATLYDNPAAEDLYAMLPRTLTFEDYNRTEKISRLSQTLNTEGMAGSYDPDTGDLCLYAPWGNLCVFYRDFGNSASLYPLGHIESGMDVIGGMTEDFTVTIETLN